MAKALRMRIDRLVAERGLAASRQTAQALVLAGRIMADGQKIDKCGTVVPESAQLTVLGGERSYVSRAGRKLAGALDHFLGDVGGKVCLDVGASTGGFTECLLERGAAKVFAVDAGVNQLAWKLRQDPRVVVMERTNARFLRPAQLGEAADLLTMDVSFISSTLIIPVLAALMNPGAEAFVLVKPQFEVGRGRVGQGGIVRDSGLHSEAIDRVSVSLLGNGFRVTGCCESSPPGAEGNREFFLHAIYRGADAANS